MPLLQSANGLTDYEKHQYFKDHPKVRFIVFLASLLKVDEAEKLRNFFDVWARYLRDEELKLQE